MSSTTAQSVRAKLTTLSRQTGRSTQELIQLYGLERFLYRLSVSPHASSFLLKGALMLRVWGTPIGRPTRDIDLHGFGSAKIEDLEATMRELCAIEVEDDGMRFDPTAVVGKRIRDEAKYEGVRIKFLGHLGRARVPMQIDIGFGDAVYPSPEQRGYPALLDAPPPTLRMIPRETVIAEKFEAMVVLGAVNSRFKDFFDLWLLSRSSSFQGEVLAEAIQSTFARRGTALAQQPVALSDEFARSKATEGQWAAFLKRSQITDAPEHFSLVALALTQFLGPPVAALIRGQSFERHWVPAGPWQPGA